VNANKISEPLVPRLLIRKAPSIGAYARNELARVTVRFAEDAPGAPERDGALTAKNKAARYINPARVLVLPIGTCLAIAKKRLRCTLMI
jgi:hypothetical protein